MTRRGLGVLGALTLGLLIAASWRSLGRSPAPTPPSELGAPASPAPSTSIARAPAGPPPDGASIDPELTTIEGDDAFRLLVFPIALAEARLRVIDLDMRRALAPSVSDLGATLVVNGGFFDPSQKPDGLVISEGKLIAPLRAELGGGVFLLSGGRASIVATEAFSLEAGPVDFALQCRPRLVVGSARNVKGDGGPLAERTALCLRDHARLMEIVVARGE